MAQSHSPNMFTSSMIAGLAGAALALLVAPRSGKETRRQLKDRAMEIKQRAKEDVSEKHESLVSNSEEVKDKMTEAANQTKHGLRETKSDNGSLGMNEI